MRTMIRLTLLATALAALAGAFALRPAASAEGDGNRFAAQFTESRVSTTDRLADLGVLQLINAGTGTVEGFGTATVMLSVTQDRSVSPCGPGSWTNAGIRRIVLDAGVLILRELAHVCQTASGPTAISNWTVDGSSSTGVFADARGSGTGSVDIATRTSTLAGKLKLANGDE